MLRPYLLFGGGGICASEFLKQRNNGDSGSSFNDVNENVPAQIATTVTWEDFAASKFANEGIPGVDGDLTAYEISSAAELALLAKRCNGDDRELWKNLSYKQTANIDLSGHEWNPIAGTGGVENGFCGSYDGNGFKIQNISITRSHPHCGLFGYLYGAFLTNITMESGTISIPSSTSHCVGSILGTGYNSTVEKCKSNVDIYVYGGTHGDGTGGIAGHLFYTDVNWCHYYGNLSGKCFANGGIAGYATPSNIDHCVFSGTISDMGSQTNGGGIVGEVLIAMIKITNCISKGSVTGGIVGSMVGKAYQVKLENCAGFGELNASTPSESGAFVGQGSVLLKGCSFVGTCNSDEISPFYGVEDSLSYVRASYSCINENKFYATGSIRIEGDETNLKDESWSAYFGLFAEMNDGLPLHKAFFHIACACDCENQKFIDNFEKNGFESFTNTSLEFWQD